MADAPALLRIKAGRPGKVHVGHRIVRFPTHHALECTGRAVSGCTPTQEPVDCGACLQKFAGNADLLGAP